MARERSGARGWGGWLSAVALVAVLGSLTGLAAANAVTEATVNGAVAQVGCATLVTRSGSLEAPGGPGRAETTATSVAATGSVDTPPGTVEARDIAAGFGSPRLPPPAQAGGPGTGSAPTLAAIPITSATDRAGTPAPVRTAYRNRLTSIFTRPSTRPG